MGFVNTLTGGGAADAAMQAGRIQNKAAQSAAEEFSPYQQLGTDNIQGLQSLIDNPMGYLQNNPMFNAAIANTGEQIKRNQALSGNFNSGGTINSLFQNYLGQGDQFLNSQYNRLLNPIQMGFNATGARGDLLTSGAAARAAGTVGAANARSQGMQNLISTGTSLALAPMTGGGSLLGNGLGFSDRRLKENIVHKGTDDAGLNVYLFNYIGGNEKFVGYMADEIQKIDPDSVKQHESGYLMVTDKYAPRKVH